MSKFFIRRPIVAIVISILMVIVGAIMVTKLPGRAIPGYRSPRNPPGGRIPRCGC